MNIFVNIDVDNLDAAVAFYTTAFGLQAGRQFGTAGVELLGGPVPIHLLTKAPGTPAAVSSTQRRDYRRHWTPIHLDFVVADMEHAVHQAVAAGASLARPVDTNDWRKLALMADPFGHGFCFIQLLGQGYDAVARHP